jgi:hypothetical protein
MKASLPLFYSSQHRQLKCIGISLLATGCDVVSKIGSCRRRRLNKAEIGGRSLAVSGFRGSSLCLTVDTDRHDQRRVGRTEYRLGSSLGRSMYASGGIRVLIKRLQIHPAIRSQAPYRFASSRSPQQKNEEPRGGTTTPVPDESSIVVSKSAYYFEAGYGLFAKRPSRPFPPPFLSPPSGSFSDPLSTHDRSRDRRPSVNGDMIRGITNGDDAVLVSDNFIGANDGVGAWASRERGHAAYDLCPYPLHPCL